MDRSHPLATAPGSRSARLGVRLAVAVVGALAGALLAVLAGLVLQPSFTRLEQAAVQLAPPEWDAQPPAEMVDALGAFDRRYRVTVQSDRLDDRVLRARAQRLGWSTSSTPVSTSTTGSGSPTGSDPTEAVVLRQGGVRARATLGARSGSITTSIDPSVRRVQLIAGAAGAVVGALAALWSLSRTWRRHPRLVVVSADRRRERGR